MKAAPFEYFRASTLAEACAQLAEHGADAKLIAGGQSLVPMMAMRLARPAWLIDIRRLEELQRIESRNDPVSSADDVVSVGAAVRQCVIERDPLARASLPLLGRALKWVGHVQTRNRGTVGGSIVHADPSAEIPLVTCVLDAVLELRDAAGATDVPAREFFLAPMVTAIAPEQCLAEIRFPVWKGARVGSAFEEVSIRQGDFALVSACAQVALDADGKCIRAALGIGGASPFPQALPEIGERLAGTQLDDRTIVDAADAAAKLIDPDGDLHATAAYRRHLARVLVERVLRSAREDVR
ncbi:MAG: FAD binding domain-containing protein [Betaproteobacteria bacterium]|nr:FAD binding domain-containing protein [Betaproteobacteria bacterium]